MAFRVKDRSMTGFIKYRVETVDVEPKMLFRVFNVHVKIGSPHVAVVRAALRSLNKPKKTRYAFDCDGQAIRVRMLSEPGWITIERQRV